MKHELSRMDLPLCSVFPTFKNGIKNPKPESSRFTQCISRYFIKFKL